MTPPSRHALRLGFARIIFAIALLVGAWVVVGLLLPNLVLPAGLRPPLREVFDHSPSPIYPIGPSGAVLGGNSADLQIEATALDETKRVVTLRVSGHRTCAPTCAAYQLVLVSLRPDEPQQRGLPPFATVSLPAQDALVQATVDLPAQEQVIQYPFDSIDLVLGVAFQAVGTDGIAQSIPATEAANDLQLTLQEEIPQLDMSTPVTLDSTLFASPSLPLDYLTIEQLTFRRSDPIRLLTLLLLVLIGTTTLYSVMLRSMHDLILGFGALILGVWGTRGILVPGALNQRTGVDVGLTVVIVFLLVALAVRASRAMAAHPNPSSELPPPEVDSRGVAGNASSAAREQPEQPTNHRHFRDPKGG